jgi:uncharacterized membrane protein
MSASACSFIVFWFSLSFTTCFGLHGNLQVSDISICNGFCRSCLRLRAALLYVGFHCLSLHVSVYIAIFRCSIYIYIYTMGFAGYVSCLQLYSMLVSTVFHYMFRPTWPCSTCATRTIECTLQITDPPSRQGGRPTETRQQPYDRK